MQVEVPVCFPGEQERVGGGAVAPVQVVEQTSLYWIWVPFFPSITDKALTALAIVLISDKISCFSNEAVLETARIKA